MVFYKIHDHSYYGGYTLKFTKEGLYNAYGLDYIENPYIDKRFYLIADNCILPANVIPFCDNLKQEIKNDCVMVSENFSMIVFTRKKFIEEYKKK